MVRKGQDKRKDYTEYKENTVTLEELYNTGETKERSLNALGNRARHQILAFAGHGLDGKILLFDEMLSIVRLRVARELKGPGKTWKVVSKIINDFDSINEEIKKEINEHHEIKKPIQIITKKIRDELRP